MNLSNKLTVSRVFVIPVFIVVLLPDSFVPGDNRLLPWVYPSCRMLALLIFLGAAITDYYDGVLARRHGWISNFGQLFDPLADKLIVMAAFVGMVELKLFPSWMVILILCREFLITGLRTLATAQGKILSADRWGKNKTIIQMTTIITALMFLSARDILTIGGYWESFFVKRWDLEQWFTFILRVMMFVCVVLTIFSGWLYVRKNWDLIREDLN